MEIILLRNYRDSGKGIGKCLSDRVSVLNGLAVIIK